MKRIVGKNMSNEEVSLLKKGDTLYVLTKKISLRESFAGKKILDLKKDDRLIFLSKKSIFSIEVIFNEKKGVVHTRCVTTYPTSDLDLSKFIRDDRDITEMRTASVPRG